MLVSFSVSNYRSFGEEATLDMVASNKLPEHPGHRVEIDDTGKFLVRSALLYGANAAGKSNLIKAMSYAQNVILSRGGSRGHLPPVDAFRFHSDFASKPSSFEFRFLIEDRVFIYGFDIQSQRITGEWLAHKQNNEEELTIFERNKSGKTDILSSDASTSFDDDRLHHNLNLMNQIPIRPTQLVLNRIASLPEEAQGKTLRSIIKWLTEDLEILETGHRACDLMERLDADQSFRKFSGNFLNKVDTGISELTFQQIERELNEVERSYVDASLDFDDYGYQMYGCWGDRFCKLHPEDESKVIERRLQASHKSDKGFSPLPFSEESEGTQQLLHFLPIISTPKNESKIIVIDEFDRSLHPLLCWEFMRFFSESCPGAKKQLIVTTHESQLLDQELLRRDEYWFVEKDKSQQSRLVSLSEFNIRNDLQIRKGYLNGRFGAIPFFGSLAELKCLLDCPTEEATDAQNEAAT